MYIVWDSLGVLMTSLVFVETSEWNLGEIDQLLH